MRFDTLVSLAFTLAATVSAATVNALPQGLAERDDFIDARDFAEGSILETRKFKESKVDLTFPKTLSKGSIAQNQREDATSLGKKAMYEAGVTAGSVIYGWHDENTEDPLEHFTIQPSSGTGSGSGKIHVHRDGSWTQGPGGKIKGTGKTAKRDTDEDEELETRDILEARKFKESKVTLTFPKTLTKGSIAQNEREEATTLGKKAMYEAGVTTGTVLYGWHDENTEDPVRHFTIQPNPNGNGKIHVHEDGSWTQGPGGKIKGTGKTAKRDTEDSEDEFETRDTDVADDSSYVLYVRDDASLLETRAKFKLGKSVDLFIPKQLQKGKIDQKDREDAQELGEKAMFQAGVTKGDVIYGWHDENTEDPENHFTIQPNPNGKGKIHVHKDGSWTQGLKGKAASGNGQV